MSADACVHGAVAVIASGVGLACSHLAPSTATSETLHIITQHHRSYTLGSSIITFCRHLYAPFSSAMLALAISRIPSYVCRFVTVCALVASIACFGWQRFLPVFCEAAERLHRVPVLICHDFTINNTNVLFSQAWRRIRRCWCPNHRRQHQSSHQAMH